jgi:hypothetical protein
VPGTQDSAPDLYQPVGCQHQTRRNLRTAQTVARRGGPLTFRSTERRGRSAMTRLINIDNGGTLTDICVVDGTDVRYTKTLTTPFDLSRACSTDCPRQSALFYVEETARSPAAIHRLHPLLDHPGHECPGPAQGPQTRASDDRPDAVRGARPDSRGKRICWPLSSAIGTPSSTWRSMMRSWRRSWSST